ncbi:MAG TPA: metalloregulator ArsR/SmtB family transcription factor [Pyrinomonadaceae bacterium]|jgi:ArsR family transcriptional regulator
MSEEKILSEMETFFMALADKTRLRLLNLMRQDEICVCFFTEVLGESQPKISRHLAYLRNAGMVEARREGKWMHYSISEPKDENAEKVLQEVLAWLANQDEMRKDHEKYQQVCCSPEMLVQIARTPMEFILPKADMLESDVKENFSPAHNELEEFML